jgi:tetratricopeptide (TPR) repeat protein
MRTDESRLIGLVDKARALSRERKYLHAEQIYHRLIREEPEFVTAYTDLAALYQETNRLGESTAILHAACGRFPANAGITFMLGNAHLRQRHYGRALSCYKQIANEKLPHVHFNMGIAHLSQGNMRAAEEQFRTTMRLDHDFPQVHEFLGELLIARKAFAEAVKHLRRAVTGNPYASGSHHLLGIALRAMGDVESAYEEFVTSIDTDPQNPQCWQRCGETLLAMKRLDEAEKYLRKALDLDPKCVDALANLGQIHFLRGERARSEEYFAKALELDPHNPTARIGRLHTRNSKKN